MGKFVDKERPILPKSRKSSGKNDKINERVTNYNKNDVLIFCLWFIRVPNPFRVKRVRTKKRGGVFHLRKVKE